MATFIIKKNQITLLCLLAAVQGGCKAGDSQEATFVRACFGGYKEAILDQDGEASVALVDESTLKYYGEMRKLALEGSLTDVRQLSTVDKLMVLTLRHQIPFEDLTEMTADSLFVYAVDEGWIGRESVINNELGDIKVSGTNATGVHISAGNESTIKWIFRKENGKWKISIISIMPIADLAFKQIVQQSGLSEDDFLFSILESVSGKKVPDSIWEPLTGAVSQ